MSIPNSGGPCQPGLVQVIETRGRAAQPDTAGASADKMDLDAHRPGSDFRVRITPTDDGGTEFFFPPMLGGAKATTQTAVFVLSIALFLLASLQAQPWLPLLAAWGSGGIVELFFLRWILRLWFAPERVLIANGVVTYTYGLFGKTRTMPTAEV